MASLRASHCSPVFYLLDNGKRRNVSALGLHVIICFIHRGIIALTFNLWTGDGSVLPHACQLYNPSSWKRDYGGAFCGRCGVAGRVLEVMKRKLVRGACLFLHTFPKSVAVDVPIDLLALQTCWKRLSSLSFAALAMRSMRVCRWLPPLFVCPRLSAGGVTSSAACGRSWLRARRKKGLCSRWVLFVLSLRLKGYFNSLWQKCLSENLMVLSSELTLISSVCMTLALRAVAPGHDNSLCIFICLRPHGVQL